MGIKEYLSGKKQKEVEYKLSDVHWATNFRMDNMKGTKELAINTPYILNKDVTKGKNIATGEIFELTGVDYSWSNPVEHALCSNAGLVYENGGCDIMNSVEFIDKACTILGHKATDSKIIYLFGRQLVKAYNYARGQVRTAVLTTFCQENKFSRTELMELADLLQKTRNAKNIKRLTKEQAEAEYERDVRDF